MTRWITGLALAISLAGATAVEAQAQRPDVTIIERRVDASTADACLRRMRLGTDSEELLMLDISFGPPQGDFSTFFAYRFGTYKFATPAGGMVFDQARSIPPTPPAACSAST